MITLDTNVLVRVFAADHPEQTALARDLFRTLTPERPGFVCLPVLVELYWVLDQTLGLSRSEVLNAFDRMMAARQLEIEDGESVGEALEQARQGADFADGLIAATSRLYGASETVTFDTKASRRFGWRLLG